MNFKKILIALALPSVVESFPIVQNSTTVQFPATSEGTFRGNYSKSNTTHPTFETETPGSIPTTSAPTTHPTIDNASWAIPTVILGPPCLITFAFGLGRIMRKREEQQEHQHQQSPCDDQNNKSPRSNKP